MSRFTPAVYNALPFAERLDLVRYAQGREKYDLLLAAADIAELVAQLPPQELHLLVRELGAEDVPELLALATTEQFTTFLDLDSWQGDRLQASEVLRWLALLLETGEEKVFQTAFELDPALLTLLLRKLVRIVGGPEDAHDDDIRAEAARRDGGYEFEYLDPKSARLVATFLDILSRHDQEFFFSLIEGVRWELEAELEELVYAERLGRLLDQGFPDPQQARAIYAWLDPAGVVAPNERKRPFALDDFGRLAPGFPLAAVPSGNLLATLLAKGGESAAWELAALVNKLLIADGVDVGKPEAVRACAAAAARTLNLALEELCDGDPQRAEQLFASCYLEHLFRAGFSLTLRLQRRARSLRREPFYPWLDGPWRAALEALAQDRPRLHSGEGRGERPFASRTDLQAAEAQLAESEALCGLFAGKLPFALPAREGWDLSGCHPATALELTLSDLLLTALGNRLLGRAFAPEPIPAAELAALQQKVTRAGKVDAALRQELRAQLDGLVAGCGPFADWCCDLWEEEFCGARDLDPRYLGGLIVRLR